MPRRRRRRRAKCSGRTSSCPVHCGGCAGAASLCTPGSPARSAFCPDSSPDVSPPSPPSAWRWAPRWPSCAFASSWRRTSARCRRRSVSAPGPCGGGLRPPPSNRKRGRTRRPARGSSIGCPDPGANQRRLTVNDDVKQHSEEVALFRFGVIGDLVHLPPGAKGLYERLREKAEIDYRIPGSLRGRVAPETIRHWLRAYRKGGLDALRPRVRADHGQSHALPREVSDLLVSIKDEKRELSVQLVIREALATGKIPEGLLLAPSTVHRLLSRAGLMAKEPGEPSSKDHRRFAFEKAGDLWMSDVMHGPAVSVAGKKRKAYLIAFIDDATRVIPYAAFALSESTAAFLPVLKEAMLRRGAARRLFVDNGSAFRSHQLALVCAKLGITLIHARPYHAQAKGKIERWFRTVRLQLLPLLQPGDLQSLDALNRRLWAWVEGEYHRSPHRGLDGATTLDKWAQVADEVRYLGPDIDDLFLNEAKRKVAKDRTVSLGGIVYEVDAALVGEVITLRHDPSKPGRTVQVWAKGKKVQDAKVVDVHANCFVRREKPEGLRLADLAKKED